MSISSKLLKLRLIIERANYEYYVLNAPTLSDTEYDCIFSEIKYIEKKYPNLITFNSPTKVIEGIFSKKSSLVHHDVLMLSLNNCYNIHDVIEFDKRICKVLKSSNIEYLCELKFDGIAISVRYINGKFSLMTTRGDGKDGENITHNINLIPSIPLNLKGKYYPKIIDIRGEAFMLRDDFKFFNEEQRKYGKKEFINTRNATAGTLRQVNSEISKIKKLSFFAYGAGLIKGYKLPNKHSKLLKLYSILGIPINNESYVVHGPNKLIDFFYLIKEKRNSFPYDIDGVVYKVNNYSQQNILGFTSRAPRFSIAHKFSAQQVLTKIIKIEMSIGRTGVITPVAICDPIFIDGATITRATLHNFNEIERKDIYIGDTVIIQRSGGVIPSIIKVLPNFREANAIKFIIPKFCPECKSRIELLPNKKIMRCTGHLSCSAQKKKVLEHFVSRSAMNINGFGQIIINQLVNEGLLVTPVDFFYLTFLSITKSKFISNKIANNLLSSINNSRKTNLSRFIYSLGIRHVGELVSQKLSEHFNSINLIMNSSIKELLNISNIGTIVAHSIYNFFSEKRNRVIINKLLNEIKITDISINTSYNNSIFNGKQIALTGKLENFSRCNIKKILTSSGAKIVEEISTQTSYLISGNKPGSKFDKALKLGVKIINEKNMCKLLKGYIK